MAVSRTLLPICLSQISSAVKASMATMRMSVIWAGWRFSPNSYRRKEDGEDMSC